MPASAKEPDYRKIDLSVAVPQNGGGWSTPVALPIGSQGRLVGVVGRRSAGDGTNFHLLVYEGAHDGVDPSAIAENDYVLLLVNETLGLPSAPAATGTWGPQAGISYNLENTVAGAPYGQVYEMRGTPETQNGKVYVSLWCSNGTGGSDATVELTLRAALVQ